MTEKEWVAKNLSGRPRSWEDLITSGRCKLDDCPKPLRILFEEYSSVVSKIEKMLNKAGYEPG